MEMVCVVRREVRKKRSRGAVQRKRTPFRLDWCGGAVENAGVFRPAPGAVQPELCGPTRPTES